VCTICRATPVPTGHLRHRDTLRGAAWGASPHVNLNAYILTPDRSWLPLAEGASRMMIQLCQLTGMN
jgi:hypothetical protein